MSNKVRSILFAGAAAIAVSACGADDVASPGAATVNITNNTPAPPPTPTPTPTGPELTAATSCPSLAGGTSITLENRGTISVGTRGTLLECAFPDDTTVTDNAIVNAADGVIYSFDGTLAVGVDDVDGAGNAGAGDPGTLTLNEGVVMFARDKDSFLLVNRGSQLNVAGTATKPVVLTAEENVRGTATQTDAELWGGVLILGRAPISECDGGAVGGAANCFKEAEGPANSALYGGNLPNDNSGSIRYLQIRFSGNSAIPDKELQGLTTGGVGDGTTIEYVQVQQSQDDGIEIFGGTHNARYLVFSGIRDDSVDTDFGWQGALQFVIAIRRDGFVTGDPTMIEIDSGGNVNSAPRQNGKIANFTFISPDTYEKIKLRGGANYTFYNGVVDSLGVAGSQCVRHNEKNNAPTTGADIQYFSVLGNCDVELDPSSDADIAAQIARGADANTDFGLTFSLTNTFMPSTDAAFANATPFGDLANADDFFIDADYIGAVRDANDTWYRGWTCDTDILDLGSGNSCLEIPAVSA